jgi:hypothetical protein
MPDDTPLPITVNDEVNSQASLLGHLVGQSRGTLISSSISRSKFPFTPGHSGAPHGVGYHAS